MVMVLAFVLVLATAVYVALPLLSSQGQPEAAEQPATPEERQRWERQKAEAYAAIKEAEFDLQTAKLSETDFRLIRDKYAAQALEAIAALDRAESASRNSGGRKPARIAYCPSCGHTVPPRANFCPGCGKGLQGAVA
mgnify:CR=1 FL=1